MVAFRQPLELRPRDKPCVEYEQSTYQPLTAGCSNSRHPLGQIGDEMKVVFCGERNKVRGSGLTSTCFRWSLGGGGLGVPLLT